MVDFSTSNGTAIAALDYLATNGTATFAAGQTMQTVTVAVIGEVIFEGDDTFFVNLSNATNATIGDVQAQGTIANDDLPDITINDYTADEGDVGISNFTFKVSISGVATSTVMVDFSVTTPTFPGRQCHWFRLGLLVRRKDRIAQRNSSQR